MWYHQESAFTSTAHGVTYYVRFIGTLPIKCSMKGLTFDGRTMVTQHTIDLVCYEADLIDQPPRNSIGTRCGESVCLGPLSCADVVLSITLDQLTLLMVPSGRVLRQHSMSNISFSYASDEDVTRRFAAFVVKEPVGCRVSVVLDCGTPERARSITTTLGQAFHLGYHRPRPIVSLPPPTTSTKSTPKTPTKTPTKAPLKSILKVPNRDNKPAPKLPPKPAPKPFKTDNNLIDFSSYSSGTNSATNSATNSEPPYYNDMPGKVPPKTNHEVLERIKSASNMTKKGEPSTTESTTSSLSQWNTSQNTVKEAPPPWNGSIAFSNLPRVLNYTLKSELQQQAWFHGPLSRYETELLVMVDGEFLVRCSHTTRGQFVLSGMVDGTVHHILLVNPEGEIRNSDGILFESITQFITYHYATKTPIVSTQTRLLLEKAVVARSWSD